MVKNKESTLRIIIGILIFIIIYIVSAFLTGIVALYPVPLLWCAAIFIAAYLITLCCRGRLLLILFLFHLGLLVFSVWLFAGQAASLFMAETPPEVLLFWSTREITFLVTPYILGAIAAMFWLGGVFWCRFKIIPNLIADIFDIGMVVFFLTILATTLAGIQNKHFLLYLCIFFLLSLAATFISRLNEQSSTNVLIPVAVFPGIILFLSLPPLFLFLQPLAAATESGKTIFKRLVTPITNFLIYLAGIIAKLSTKLGKLNETANTGDTTPPLEMASGDYSSSLPPWLQQVLVIMLNILIVIAIIAAILVTLFYLYRYLTTRKYEGEKVNFWKDFYEWLNVLYKRVLSILLWLPRILKRNKVKASIKIYKRFFRIGRWFGFDRLTTETPSEYSKRLSRLLPMHINDIQLICEGLNCEIFAGSEPDAKQLEQLKKAGHNLYGLKNRLYCLRLKWFKK